MRAERMAWRGMALGAMLAALAGCARIPTAPAGPADPLERHLAAQAALGDAPIVPGNRVTVLDGGAASFAAMFDAIAAARDHVHLEFYILQDVRVPGRPGPSLFELLAEKLRQGVGVALLYDAFGSAAVPAEKFAALRALGARTLAFNPVDPLRARAGWAPNDRDHRKVLVVDGRIGFTGGVNLDKVYENPCHGPSTGFPVGDVGDACWRDTAIRIEGPAVAELQRLFLHNWQKQRGPALACSCFPPLPQAGPTRLAILGSAPEEGEPRFYRALMAAIGSARQRVWLATGFFVPTHDEREALAAAARRGVDVQLVLPSVNGVPTALAAQHAAYDDLLKAGVRIAEVEGEVLHAKLAMVDGVWTAIGSSNLDRRSVAWNDEVDALALGPEVAGQVAVVMQRDARLAQPVTLAGWRARGLGERLRELWARIWVDLL